MYRCGTITADPSWDINSPRRLPIVPGRSSGTAGTDPGARTFPLLLSAFLYYTPPSHNLCSRPSRVSFVCSWVIQGQTQRKLHSHSKPPPSYTTTACWRSRKNQIRLQNVISYQEPKNKPPRCPRSHPRQIPCRSARPSRYGFRMSPTLVVIRLSLALMTHSSAGPSRRANCPYFHTSIRMETRHQFPSWVRNECTVLRRSAHLRLLAR